MIDILTVYAFSHLLIGIIMAFKWEEVDEYSSDMKALIWFISILFGWIAFIVMAIKKIIMDKW